MKLGLTPFQFPYKTKNLMLKAIPALPSHTIKKIPIKLQQKRIVLILGIVIIANTIMMKNLEQLRLEIYISPIMLI
jgi:hypothetical protein